VKIVAAGLQIAGWLVLLLLCCAVQAETRESVTQAVYRGSTVVERPATVEECRRRAAELEEVAGTTATLKCQVSYTYVRVATPPPPPPPADTDSDGVPDSSDQCPTVPASTPDGCPATPPQVSVTIWGSQSPASSDARTDSDAVTLGTRFRSSVAGHVTAIRFYKHSGNSGAHTGALWSASGQLLAQVPFSGETASGWQEAKLSTPVAIAANASYVVSYHTRSGYIRQSRAFPMIVPGGVLTAESGLYSYGSLSLPTQTFEASAYWVDVVFSPGEVPAPEPEPEPTGSASLRWDAEEGFTGFELMQSASPNGPWSGVATLNPAARNYQVSALPRGTHYWRLTASVGSESLYSNVVSKTIP
jgi:hypothetical protein